MENKNKEKIIQDYKAGMRFCEMEKKYGIKTPRIIYLLKKDGCFKPKSKENHWTDLEIEFLQNNYSNMSWDELLTNLPKHKKSSIISKASELDLRRKNICFSSFTEAEDLIIIENYAIFGPKYISKNLLPHRSKNSIVSRANFLGIKKRNMWSKNEEKILIEKYENSTVDEVMALLPGRTRNAVISHAMKLGLKSPINRDFTIQDDDFIKDNYLELSDDELAHELNRDRWTVKNRRNFLKLHRPRVNCTFPEYLRAHNYYWKQESMKDCGYKCVVTGKHFDEIHHLYGMNLIMEELCAELGIDMTFDINSASEEYRETILESFHKIQSKYPLGVCLTKEVHIAFHSIYGYGDNTPDQFEEFLKDYKIAC